MKKNICFILLPVLLALCGCQESVGIIGGTDGPTSIIVSKNAEIQGAISPVRLINVNSVLYFDSGILSRLDARCGTLDGSLTKAVSEFEIPKHHGEANFEKEKYFGYQSATSISKELPLDEGWVVFKKIEDYGKNLTKYKYAYFIEGTHPNAKKSSKYIVMADTLDISFETITKYFFSSQLEDHLIDIAVIIPETSDEWGILMYADNITKNGVSLFIEQFGGNVKGELQTGTAYSLEIYENDQWKEVETKTGCPAVWNYVAYNLPFNEIREFKLDFSFIYNELKPGRYRIGKEISDYIAPGEYEEKTYYADFEIKE